MVRTKIAFLVVCVMFLQSCASAYPALQSAENVKTSSIAKSWRAFDPNSGHGSNSECPFCWARRYDLRADENNPDLYWARLRKSESGYVLFDLSPTPLQRFNVNEEIIAVDAQRKLVHQAFSSRVKDRDVVSSAACKKQEIDTVSPYTVCNSAFAGSAATIVEARVIVGMMTLGATELNMRDRVEKTYLPDSLARAIYGQSIETLIPAAAEKRVIAKIEAERFATEKREATRKANLETNLRLADMKKAAEAASVKALTKLPKGHKDVCDYAPIVVAQPHAPSKSDELVCINIGNVASLSSLRQAGFIVTNFIERKAGDPRTTRYNVKKLVGTESFLCFQCWASL